MHLTNQNLPPWVVLHLPHNSTEIPATVRDQFLISDDELASELEILTDHHVEALFIDPEDPSPYSVMRGAVSRLVVDLERFVDDEREPAAKHGFGAIYTRTTTGKALRRDLASEERADLLSRHEYHNRLLALVVDSYLKAHGRCLVLDCHTFPDQVLPFEIDDGDQERPDICIGSDPHHTPPALVRAFVSAFEQQGWSVAVNRPFAGALVPQHAYAKNVDVEAIMVDVNRRICVDEDGPVDGPGHAIARRVQASCRLAIATYLEEEEAASEPKNLLELAAEEIAKDLRESGYTDLGSIPESDTGRLTVNFVPHRKATKSAKTPADSSEECEGKAEESANTDKNTTGKKTQRVSRLRELSADDPIYSRGFVIGTRHSAKTNKPNVPQQGD